MGVAHIVHPGQVVLILSSLWRFVSSSTCLHVLRKDLAEYNFIKCLLYFKTDNVDTNILFNKRIYFNCETKSRTFAKLTPRGFVRLVMCRAV